MLTYKDFLLTEDVNGKQNLMDTLRKKVPDIDLSKVNARFKTFSVNDMWSIIFLTGYEYFDDMCGNDKNVIKEVCKVISDMLDEYPDFAMEMHDHDKNSRKIPRSKHISLNTKIADALKKYYAWDGGDGGLRNVKLSPGITFKKFIDIMSDFRMTETDKIKAIYGDRYDSSTHRHIIDLAEIANGKKLNTKNDIATIWR